MNVTSQAELDTLLSSTSKLVVIQFHAPSRRDEVEIELDHVTFVNVDVEAVKPLAKHYNITTTPTFVFLNRKEVVETIEGHDIIKITEALYKHEPKDEPTKDSEPSKPEPTPSNPPAEPTPPVTLSTQVLDSMWNSSALANADTKSLPAPRHLDDTLSQLRITFLQKTQRKAVNIVEGVPLVEPTLALYCPIEGGEYVVDATVKDLAQKTGAEVQVIDMAHVAAGEWGNFGKLASGFRFKNNPLGKVGPAEESGDDDDDTKNVEALEAFWRAVVESNPPVPVANEKEPESADTKRVEESSSAEPASTEPATAETTTTESTPTESAPTEPVPTEPISTEPAPPKPTSPRPRIIYIRDFTILHTRSHTWFPPLYTAVRARRTGPNPDSSIANPTTIIFGISPPVSSMIPSLTDSGGCGCSSCRPSAKQWDESSTKERAKRLKGLKEKWDKGTLSKDLPAFKPTVKIPKEKKVDAKEEVKDGSEGEKKDEAKDEKKDEAKGEAKEEAKDESKDETESEDDSDDSESSSDSESSESESSKKDDSNHERKLDGYFRVCIVAPATRSSKLERAAREKRRRELNELMLRMMVGAKGGEIGSGAAPESEEDGDLVKGWAERLVESDALKDVVDRALGMAMLADLEQGEEEQEKVLVSWAQLQDSWKAKHSGDEERKAWTAADGSDDEGSDEEKKKEDEEEKPPVDEVIEKVKAADLDEYEQRLVGCIVDVGKLPTTFENVHLPMQVIDSVRSIVSLPLLFPDAFKSGILKQQAISGALLFGPPGTGKTLVVRALAKESGARMLAIKPSDIADKWVGETEKLVKSLFKLARRLKPCVVFIDEIDSLMGSRQSKACGGSARWHTSMLTEFMQEMDGLMASSVIVIGATNRPFDIDDAVLRRLPCRLLVDLPGERAREEILKIMLRDDKLGPDVSISELAKKTDRFSGSDLKHLCVAAAMDALKESVKLPWATKKEESKDAPSANGAPVAGAKPAANGATESEKDAAKPASSDASDDDSSVPSSSEPSSGSSTPPSSGITTPGEEPAKSEPEPPKPRLLEARHFTRALMDIAPSSSESQGSLSDLRKWNTQFGTGAREQPQTRGAGSLPYSYGGAKASGAGLSGVNGVSSYGGLGSSGLGSGGGYGSTSLGASGLGLGSGAGFGSSGLGSSGYGSSGYGASGLGASGPGYGAAGGGYTPTYTPPSAGGASAGTGSAPKFPVYTRNIPGYNPSAPGDGSSAPGL